MSHSTCLVIGEDPDDLLAPYAEELEVEPYRKYVDEQKPQDHWIFDTLVEKHGLKPDADWASFISAYNTRYSEDERLIHDADIDRAYEMSTYNPKSRWDWYTLGGRWTGFFDLRVGASGATGRPGLMTLPATGGRVDQARKADIDFDAMRARVGAEAAKDHRRVMAVLADQPPMLAWSRYREEWPSDINKARAAYNAQPGLAALRKADIFTLECPVEAFYLNAVEPETAYVAAMTKRMTLPFAICSPDGWAEKGRMGWWAIVIDETDDWDDRAQQIIDAAPNDALFSLYDLHI